MSQNTPKKPLSTSEYIGERLKKARESRNLTQIELGELVHLSKSEVSHLERGDRQMTPENAFRFAEVLGCSLDYLLYGERKIQDLFIHLNEQHFIACEYSNGKLFLEQIEKLSAENFKDFDDALFKDYLDHCPDDLKLDIIRKMFAYFQLNLRANDPAHANYEGLSHFLDSQRII